MLPPDRVFSAEQIQLVTHVYNLIDQRLRAGLTSFFVRTNDCANRIGKS
jgi:hypothetical protein